MIYLSKAIVEDIPISALPVYISMRMRMHKGQEEDYITAGTICYTLGLPFDRYWHDETRVGMLWLWDKDHIDIVERDTVNHGCVIDISKLNLQQGEYFIQIDEDDLLRITKSDLQNNKKLSMIKYYITLMGSFNHSKDLKEYSGKVSTVPISFLASQTGISEKSIQRYNEWLEDHELIYIHRSADFIKKAGGLSQITNVYSRPCDKRVCDEYAKQYEEQYGYNSSVKSYKTKGQADRNRSLAQKYRQMCKGKQYDPETTEEIRRYIENTNRKAQEELDTMIEVGATEELIELLKSKIRDTSVFEQTVKEEIA